MKSIFNIKFLFIAICFGIFMIPAMSHAATVTWTAGGNSTWNTSSSWSTGAVPTTNDTALFSASSSANCSLPFNFNGGYNVGGVIITNGYGGTITQSDDLYVLGAAGWTQTGGTFTGTVNKLQVTGNFSFTGGTFTSPSALNLGGASDTFSSGFHNNSGTTSFYASSTNMTVTGSSTFYGVEFGAYGVVGNSVADVKLSVATGTVLIVQGPLIWNSGGFAVDLAGGGEIDAQGDILLQTYLDSVTSHIVSGNTFNLVINGSGTQTINDEGFSDFAYGRLNYLLLPSVTINKPSGVLNLAGAIAVTGNFTNDNGASIINSGTSTMVFFGAQTTSSSVTQTITGSSTFNNLWFGSSRSNGVATSTFIIATGTIINAQSELYFSTGCCSASPYVLQGGGTLNVQGNIGANPEAEYAGPSTVPITMNGTSTQIIGDSGPCTSQGVQCNIIFFPNLTITKTSGSVEISSDITFGGNFTNTHGTTMSPDQGTTVTFGEGFNSVTNLPATSTPSSFIVTGSSTFYNLVIGNYDGGTPDTIFTVATGTVINTQNLAITRASNNDYVQFLGGGSIYVQGNIEAEFYKRSTFPASTVPITLNGTSTQIIGDKSLCGCGINDNLFYTSIPNLTIAKPSGVVYVESPLEVGGTTTISSGELSLATGTQANPLTFDGALTISSGARLSDYPTQSSTIILGTSLVNNGTVFFDGTGQGCTATLPNYVILNSTNPGNVQIPWSGSGNFIMRYVDVADQGGTANISVLNGTQDGSDDGGNWTFTTGPEVGLVQSVTNSGGSGTGQLALPAFGIYPRISDMVLVAVAASNQSIVAPTDSAGNTYTLVASTTFGSSPTYSLSMYYAKNINTSSSFVVTVHGANSLGSNFLSASAFDYTGIAPSSTFEAYSSNVDAGGGATSLSTLSATGHSRNELYVGAATFAASTTLSSGAGWTPEAGIANNSTAQAIYVEDFATTTTPFTTAATWTAATGTSYTGIMGIFRAPYFNSYPASGTLDSATFDTRSSGAQLNSVIWQGSVPNVSWGAGFPVGFQFAVSNSSNGPWNYLGPSGDATTYFHNSYPGNNVPINLVATNGAGYSLFSGYRYFRYRITLFADPTFVYTPTVSQVTVNWSP